MAHMFAVSAFRDAGIVGGEGAFGGSQWGAEPVLNLNDPAILRCLLEQVPTPTALVEGTAGTCSFSNAAFRALGVVAGGLLPTQFPAVSGSLLAAARCEGEPQRGRFAGEDDRHWDVRVTPMMGVNGVVRALIVTVDEVPEVLVEHDRQMRELSHRVKNTLQLVSSLLTLQTLGAKDPEVRRALQSAGGRIGIVTQAHQRTHGALRAHDLDVADHLRALCAELEATLPGARRIRVQAEPTCLPVDSVIPLSLIVNELVGNAAKHAYAPDEPGGIEVTLGRDEAGRRQLVVTDHGRGLPEGLDVARATTLGLKVVRAFAGQLKGGLRAEPVGQGARLVVDLPG